MGTSNFYRGNTSRVFAVFMDEEVYVCSECGEYHYEEVNECYNGCEGTTFEMEYRAVDEIEIDDFKGYIREVANDKRGEFYFRKESGMDRDRNYPSNELFSYSIRNSFGDIGVEVRLTAKMTAGYYEGASLDFDIDVEDDGFDNSDMNGGMRVIQERNANKWVDRTKEQLIARVEEVFEQVSMPMKVVLTFSNGETIYGKL